MINKFKFWKKNKAINKFKEINSTPAIKTDALITFKQLEDIPINIVNQILPDKKGSIETTRLYNETEDLTFRVHMKKDEVWNFHHHDCEEIILIHKGKLKVSISEKIYNKGNIFKIYKNINHSVKALEDSIFYVEFKKP